MPDSDSTDNNDNISNNGADHNPTAESSTSSSTNTESHRRDAPSTQPQSPPPPPHSHHGHFHVMPVPMPMMPIPLPLPMAIPPPGAMHIPFGPFGPTFLPRPLPQPSAATAVAAPSATERPSTTASSSSTSTSQSQTHMTHLDTPAGPAHFISSGPAPTSDTGMGVGLSGRDLPGVHGSFGGPSSGTTTSSSSSDPALATGGVGEVFEARRMLVNDNHGRSLVLNIFSGPPPPLPQSSESAMHNHQSSSSSESDARATAGGSTRVEGHSSSGLVSSASDEIPFPSEDLFGPPTEETDREFEMLLAQLDEGPDNDLGMEGADQHVFLDRGQNSEPPGRGHTRMIFGPSVPPSSASALARHLEGIPPRNSTGGSSTNTGPEARTNDPALPPPPPQIGIMPPGPAFRFFVPSRPDVDNPGAGAGPNSAAAGEGTGAGPGAGARTVPGLAPGLPPDLAPFFNLFMPLFPGFGFGPPPSAAPDPEKAAELLRSLPTVGRALFQRVNKIYEAEEVEESDDKGWKCGVCLEGVSAEADTPPERETITIEEDAQEQGTGVKALPCNHLFHGDCLEPWFASHHTCPTCRLDLDPLNTLRGSAEAPGAGRAQDGEGSGAARRRNAHPYARDPATATFAAGSVPAAPQTQPQRQQSQGENGTADDGNQADTPNGSERSFTFIWGPRPPLHDQRQHQHHHHGHQTETQPRPSQNHAQSHSHHHQPEHLAHGIQSQDPSLPHPQPDPHVHNQPQDPHQPHLHIHHIGHHHAMPDMVIPHQLPPGAIPMFGPPPPLGRPFNFTSAPPPVAPITDAAPTTPARGANARTHAHAIAQNIILSGPIQASPAQMERRSSPVPGPVPGSSVTLNSENAAETHSASASPTASPNPARAFGAEPAVYQEGARETRRGGDDRPVPERTSRYVPVPWPGFPAPPGFMAGPGLAMGPAGGMEGEGGQEAGMETGMHGTSFSFIINGPPPPGFMAPPPPPPTAPSAHDERDQQDRASSDDRQNPPSASSAPKSPRRPFVPQSLESWTAEKERELGWRCQAPECLIAPSVTGDVVLSETNDIGMYSLNEKEMLSILSPLQPYLSSAPSTSNTSAATEQVTPMSSDSPQAEAFEIHACPHQWHRACLEAAERAAGRWALSDVRGSEGRVWVRCGRCRNDGWVRTAQKVSEKSGMKSEREDMMSSDEKEVENLVQVV